MTALVLMYHGTPRGLPFTQWSLQADLFRSHLDLVCREGWKVVTVGGLLAEPPGSEKTLAITFDDGYADNFEGAFLPLLERGLKATWFITTGSIGGHAQWDRPSDEQNRMLSMAQLVEMSAQGMEIGSHSHSHPDLSRLTPEKQRQELSRSKEILEDLLGKRVDGFAYPYGYYDHSTLEALEYTGYRWACSTKSGWYRPQENPFLIRRITIFSGDTEVTLKRKLRFADNDVSWKRMVTYYAGRLAHRLGLDGRYRT